MPEFSAALAAAVKALGGVVEQTRDHDQAQRAGSVAIVVPESDIEANQRSSYATGAEMRRAIAVITERPGTDRFESVVDSARSAGAVCALRLDASRELRRRGIAAAHMPVGFVEEWRCEPARDEVDAIGLVCIGEAGVRRKRMLATLGRLITDRSVELHLFDGRLPFGREVLPHSRARRRLLSRTRIYLELDDNDMVFAGWHRIAEAVSNGCLIIADSSVVPSHFRAGEHYLAVSEQTIAPIVSMVLEDPDRHQGVRLAGQRIARQRMGIRRLAALLVRLADGLGATSLPVVAPKRLAIGQRAPSLPETEYAWVQRQAGELAELRLVVADLLRRQRSLARRLALMEGRDSGLLEGDWTSDRYAAVVPRISVVVPVFDHADVIGEAVESVAAAADDAVEMVVVDDGSADASATAARAAVERYPWLAARILRRRVNAGLGAARNLAVQQARGALLLMLDADNTIYPSALETLTAALDADTAAVAAYGILEQFSGEASVGLLSCSAWQPERFRYGGYIDALALIRAEALREVGGYCVDGSIAEGWEDFALWCSFADRGWHAAFVPNIVARYRVTPGSLITYANLDAARSWEALRRRFRFLRADRRGTMREYPAAARPEQ